MSDYKFQDSIKALDAQGLEHMLNITANTVQELFDNRDALLNYIKDWKPLPIRQSGFGSKAPAKEIKAWADVPKCPKHGALARPNPWKDHPGRFWWNCPASDDTGWCKEKLGAATQEQFDAYNRLDPDEKPKPGDIQEKPSNVVILSTLRQELRGYIPELPTLKPTERDTAAKVLACIAQTRKQLLEVKAKA